MELARHGSMWAGRCSGRPIRWDGWARRRAGGGQRRRKSRSWSWSHAAQTEEEVSCHLPNSLAKVHSSPADTLCVNQCSRCKGREGATAKVRIALIRRGRAKSSPRRPATPRSSRAATGCCSRTAHLAGRPSRLMRGLSSVEELPAEPQRRRDRLPG